MKIKSWFAAIRPKTLILSQLPVMVGFAFASEQIPHQSSLFNLLLCSLLALLMQAAANLVNDYHDGASGLDQPGRIGPIRATATGLIPGNQIKTLAIGLLFLSFLLGLFLVREGGIPILGLGLLCLLVAYTYTGGPYPLSHLGLGEMVAYLFFGPLATWGTFILQQTHALNFHPLMGHLPGTAAALLMLVNNLRDIEQDAHPQLGKKTLVVRLGLRRGRMIFFCLLISVPVYIFLYFFFYSLLDSSFHSSFYSFIFFLLAALIPFLFWKTWAVILREGPSEKYNLALAKTAQCFLLTTILFCLGIFI